VGVIGSGVVMLCNTSFLLTKFLAQHVILAALDRENVNNGLLDRLVSIRNRSFVWFCADVKVQGKKTCPGYLIGCICQAKG
jgi:hypothetical protein